MDMKLITTRRKDNLYISYKILVLIITLPANVLLNK